MSTANILDASLNIATGDRPPLALIAGPTASGKSDCAVMLAQELERHGRRCVVVNADSSQVYADLQVLSARPTPEEMGGIEHRLFGDWDGAQSCSAADWADAARRTISQIHADGALPILVGGTGLYIRTLLEGIAPVPAIEPGIREAVRALPVEDAYAALRQEDPERAARLAPADAARIARALEVVRSSGKTLAQWQTETTGGIADTVTVFPAILLPERQALYRRCDLRFERMIERGALAEVEALLARDLDPTLPVMRAIGVPELAGVVRGEWTLGEATARGSQATRNYAKRQFTWLRHQPPEDWPRLPFENFDSNAMREILFRIFHLT
ncbi:tRNA (adenosine(37)-N6)-dimethylallyltransferase MiaA [Novosphingobium sp. KN65.2]|uniref:tRNA (adenosine(37)-N6)-dimethylallyltransferase MiaA n=1 Tax=Novosphingobium sp. KN65.2 TaxID=1478134 RepID=UPI0005E94918|nr:tRNA (adenosine(37)-N6)-dimethylallyltransferase MiaA [Novosphingobium sp. KN65.2]CDO36374.1 tRNA delta(2)-isopentenylpyrophosphate transferase (IPP transferase) (Isopentenyl-diphosphate:tRNA isopentenyltransferase) (IPTase) (IPPT) [Novosphingobium sp. KN65.2]